MELDVTRTSRVVQAIAGERARQRRIGYTTESDDAKGPAALVGYAVDHLTHLGEVSSSSAVRVELIQAAALIVAAIEFHDRTGT